MGETNRTRRPARPGVAGRERRHPDAANEACPAARRRRASGEEAARIERLERVATTERRRLVERLRDEILRGVYHADPEKVAEAILAKVPKLILQ